jgi:excisionase family DNA binding protein
MLLTTAQVAAITNYSVDTVRAKFASGELPGRRNGKGHWRAVEAEILAAIAPNGQRNQNDIAARVRAGLRRSALNVKR